MVDKKNPLADRVSKMAAIIEAAKKVGKEIQEEKAREGQAEMGQSSPSPEQAPS